MITEIRKKHIREQKRFGGIFDAAKYKDGRFDRLIPLSGVHNFDECKENLIAAYESGFDGFQRNAFEDELKKYVGAKYALLTNSGESALHLAIKLAAERVYGSTGGVTYPDGGGCLFGKKVFCQNLSTGDMVAPVLMEGGEPVFIDSAEDDWCMDPEVLIMAFDKYPNVKIVIMNHVYGYPGDAAVINEICIDREAILIECASDALGASSNVLYVDPEGNPGDDEWINAGCFGDYGVYDFGRGKIIGCGDGGALLCRDRYSYDKAKYWATGAKANTSWRQHEELGYRFLMSDETAAVLRGQLLHIDEIIDRKNEIYDRYFNELDGDLSSILSERDDARANFWTTVMTCESNIQFNEIRDDRRYLYETAHGTASPMEIYDALLAFNVESAPVYKPMSLQPVYRNFEYFTLDGPWRMYQSFNNDSFMQRCDMSKQYYESGIVLPSDISMTEEEQDIIIELIRACFE